MAVDYVSKKEALKGAFRHEIQFSDEHLEVIWFDAAGVNVAMGSFPKDKTEPASFTMGTLFVVAPEAHTMRDAGKLRSVEATGIPYKE